MEKTPPADWVRCAIAPAAPGVWTETRVTGVGPVLLQADRIALPTPAGDKGVWNFSGPMTNQTAAPVIAVDPRHFNDQPVIATEGRLLLLNEE